MNATRFLSLTLLFAAATTALAAQTPATPPPAKPFHRPVFSSNVTRADERPQGVHSPVPAALISGHTVFLSNAGADAGLFPHPFTGTQDRAYAYVYKALAAGPRFELVDTPAKADLVMELQLVAPMGPLGDNKQNGTADPLPEFKLVIYDRATHYILWTLSQTVDQATRQKTHDANFNDALDLLLTALMQLTSPGA